MKKIQLIFNITLFITCHQAILHAQENKRKEYSGDYAATFNDTPIIAEERDFAAEYPDLAYGFMLTKLDFQKFMASRLNNRLAHEATESSKRQKTSLLDDAITAAEDKIRRPLLDKFHEKLFHTIVNNKNPNKIQAKHFIYTRESSFLKDDLLSEIQNPDSRYQKILMAALMKDNHTYIEFLMNLEVDLTSLRFNSNKSILALALSYESNNILIALTQAPEININEIHSIALGKKTTLHMAIAMQNVQLVTSLLKHQDIDMNIPDDRGVNPFMQAFTVSHIHKYTIIDLLLHRPEVNIHQHNHRHQNALHFVAMYANNNKYIKILIDAGLNINSQDSYGWTPLHIAIENNCINNVKTLLDLGADKTMVVRDPYRNPYYILNMRNYTCMNLAKTEEMKNLLTHHGQN